MNKKVIYQRYYFPNGLRWTLLVLLVPMATYFIFLSWYVASFICLMLVLTLWTTKYITSIDTINKIINDKFLIVGIPTGKTLQFHRLECLQVSRENKKYKAASRSREYWVNYTEFTLSLKYDESKLLTLFTMNDSDQFKYQVEKFAKELSLDVQ
ncbi:MAG: hypothetical protein NXI20_03010 [bacterium]|nr:hypothetical protein [bacterium]